MFDLKYSKNVKMAELRNEVFEYIAYECQNICAVEYCVLILYRWARVIYFYNAINPSDGSFPVQAWIHESYLLFRMICGHIFVT